MDFKKAPILLITLLLFATGLQAQTKHKKDR